MIKVYSKNYCPFCVQAKALLDSLDVNYEEVDISDTPEKMIEISKISGLMTVPQIFVGEKCLGGFSEIAKLHQAGKLLDALME